MVRHSGTTQLRRILIADRESRSHRWAIPGHTDEYLADLRAGRSVIVSSAQLLRAAMNASQPYDRWAYGGRDWGKTFMLDERDQLNELSSMEFG